MKNPNLVVKFAFIHLLYKKMLLVQQYFPSFFSEVYTNLDLSSLMHVTIQVVWTFAHDSTKYVTNQLYVNVCKEKRWNELLDNVQ
jgi:hypothetical protein